MIDDMTCDHPKDQRERRTHLMGIRYDSERCKVCGLWRFKARTATEAEWGEWKEWLRDE